ncbi:dienelactone hydrolase family protein [Parafrigoribacterium soli]|uniref:dienelactone hydrolase family protein n=1 Tax=Parafrigoribacterium soli TaxID=3144663 RepID=UPI0032F07584
MGTSIEIDTADGSLPAYRSEPSGAPRGGIVLIHEIWGLVEHIRGVADRLAEAGYLVIAPDLLSGVGVVPEVGQQLQELTFSSDEARRTEAQPLMREKLAPARSPEYGRWAVEALGSVVDLVAAEPGVDGRIAVIGFCFGGSYSFALAAADPRVRAAVPFYGQPPETSELGSISCPVLAFYGDQDERLMEALPRVTQEMADAGVDFTPRVYEGARHAFFNESNSATYDADAAADAWQRTLTFLDERLPSPEPSASS